MKKAVYLFGTLVVLFCLAGAVFAQSSTPDGLVKGVVDEVISIVQTDKGIQTGDTRKAVDLIEKKVLPNFDFSRMTRLAVGKDWKQASTDQRTALTQEFKMLLVRTYSNALTKYRNQQIDVRPYKAKSDDTEALVHTEIRQAGAKSIQIDYNMEKLGDSWKVYDVLVAGVSLVSNYRDSFSQEVQAGGIDGLIKSLRDKNKSNDSLATK